MKHHDKIVNRILANYLERCLDEGEMKCGNSDIIAHLRCSGLCTEDCDDVIKSAKKRLAGFRRISKPLSSRAIEWHKELTTPHQLT